MSALDWIPGARALEAGALVAVVLAVGGVYVKQRLEIVHAHRAVLAAGLALDEEREAHARDLALAKSAADAGTIANQSETIRRTDAQREIDNETQRLETRGRDAAVRAAAADPGLRDAFARAAPAARSCPAAGNPAAAGGAATAIAADVVRSDVFGRLDDAAGELAAAADLAHARGLGCERAYDSLTGARP